MATVTDLINFFRDHQWNYGEGPGRLDPTHSGYTDCSGSVRFAFMQVLGIDPGTWTGDQINHGTPLGQPAIGQLQPGDLVFLDWKGTSYTPAYDHVVMYIGGGQVLSHGGPGRGPVQESLAGVLAAAMRWEARRYTNATGQGTAPGPYVGSNITHRPTADIQRLVGANPDGIYGPDTTAKVKAWQSAHGLVSDGIWGPASDAKGFPPTPVAPSTPTTPAALTVDGVMGPLTIKALQRVLGTPQDGVISQPVSTMVKALQSFLNGHGAKLNVDGSWGPLTTKALQSYLGAGLAIDGVLGPLTIKALQSRLNAGHM